MCEKCENLGSIIGHLYSLLYYIIVTDLQHCKLVHALLYMEIILHIIHVR